MTLFEGRPQDTEGRLPREIRTYDYLDNLQIPYQRTDHERADNMEACNEIDAVLLIDEDVLGDEYLGCHPCVCTSSLKLRTKDVIEKFLPATGHAYTTVHLVGED